MRELEKLLLWMVLCGTAMIMSGCNSAQSQANKDTVTSSAPTQIAALTLLDNTPSPTELPYITRTATSTYEPTSPPRPTNTPHPGQAAKATYAAEQELTQIARITAVALSPSPIPPTPHPIYTREPLPTGLSQSTHTGVHLCDCMFRNVWRQIVSDEYILVFAGAYNRYTSRSGLGMLYIEASNLSNGTSRIDRYDAPDNAGTLHIVSVSGSQLMLATDNDEQFAFDVVSRQWTSPPPSPSTTLTPVLTSVPSPSLPPMPTISPITSPSP